MSGHCSVSASRASIPQRQKSSLRKRDPKLQGPRFRRDDEMRDDSVRGGEKLYRDGVL